MDGERHSWTFEPPCVLWRPVGSTEPLRPIRDPQLVVPHDARRAESLFETPSTGPRLTRQGGAVANRGATRPRSSPAKWCTSGHCSGARNALRNRHFPSPSRPAPFPRRARRLQRIALDHPPACRQRRRGWTGTPGSQGAHPRADPRQAQQHRREGRGSRCGWLGRSKLEASVRVARNSS